MCFNSFLLSFPCLFLSLFLPPFNPSFVESVYFDLSQFFSTSSCLVCFLSVSTAYVSLLFTSACMSACLSCLSPSICVSIYLPACLCVCLPIFVSMSACLYLSL